MEPKGAQREPKGSQRTTKMEPKADPEAMSEKRLQKGRQNRPFWDHFGSQDRSKIDEKIDAKIDAQKVMKNDEKMMEKVIKI